MRKMENNREELLKELWAAQDKAYALMCEYDSLPHHYGEFILYQAEGDVVSLISKKPDITVTDLANILKKTPSACSQIVRKLCDKGLVEQTRNEINKRVYNLNLTKEGKKLHKSHRDFNKECQAQTFDFLERFTDEEIKNHLKIQQVLNIVYQNDIYKSREKFLMDENKIK